MSLNSITAERYTVEQLPSAVIGSAYVYRIYQPENITVYAVPFVLDGQAYSMHVWQEPDGSLYGEW